MIKDARKLILSTPSDEGKGLLSRMHAAIQRGGSSRKTGPRTNRDSFIPRNGHPESSILRSLSILNDDNWYDKLS